MHDKLLVWLSTLLLVLYIWTSNGKETFLSGVKENYNIRHAADRHGEWRVLSSLDHEAKY